MSKAGSLNKDGSPKWAQRQDELAELADLLRTEGVTSYLEIGLQRALTFRHFGYLLPTGSLMVGVDIPHAAWGVWDGQEYIEAAVRELESIGQRAAVVWGDSKATSTIEAVAGLGPYDFVLIDGDHGAVGVRADWANYGGMARMVAFHDIDVSNHPKIKAASLERYGVRDLWNELRGRFRHVEIIGRERGMGLGVLWT